MYILTVFTPSSEKNVHKLNKQTLMMDLFRYRQVVMSSGEQQKYEIYIYVRGR